MKKYALYLSLGIAIAFASCKNNNSSLTAESTASEVVKEIAGTKTTVVSYKTEMKSEGIKSLITSTQWIDHANERFASEMTTEMEMMGKKTKTTTLIISDGVWDYMLNPDLKTGFKSKQGSDTEDDPKQLIKPDDDQTFRQIIEKEGGKIIGNETVLGKNCIVVEITGEGHPVKMWYYKGIPLKVSGKEYTMEATQIQENVSIPESRFKVPEGYTLSEMPDMQ